MSTQDIYNYRQVDENTITGGQPTEEQLKAAAEEGFEHVINLATFQPGHSLPDEAVSVQALGMAYHPIPVEWQDPKLSDFNAFEAVMQQLGGGKTLIHCAANFRVTAFYGLYAQKHLGWTEEQMEEFRASVWAGSQYPVWEAFIRQVREAIGNE
jgi:protein tyrosine phosphatase (PTP) superfamily phosphohydrolase (DUF442 family)